jgi:hypothetical protein
MFVRGSAVETNAGYARNSKFNHQHIAFFTGGIVTGRCIYFADRTIGKDTGIKAGRSLGIFIVPDANRVLFHGAILSRYQQARHDLASF